MAEDFKFTIENQKIFLDQIKRLGQAVSDFRPVFRLIASDFYRSNKKIFGLKSPGKYKDLSESYKPQKMKKVGKLYPILVGETRNLSQSILQKDHVNSVFFLGKERLDMGTNVSYAKFHQSDEPRRKIPLRKFIFIDGGPFDDAKDGKNGRRERWTSIIETHIEQVLTGRVRI